MGKKLRLLFPQWQGGTGPDYSLGARLLAFLAPEDHETPLMEVPVDPFGSYELKLEKGMFARSALIRQLEAAASIIQAYRPDQLITFGGDCLVDQAPIDYLNGRYGGDYGVLWVDAHPDISNTDIFPNGNSMLVGSLMGKGDAEFAAHVRNRMTPEQFLYCGVQPSATPAEQVLVENSGIRLIPPAELAATSQPVLDWVTEHGYRHISIHLDVDVIKPELFHSNVFEKPEPISTDCSHGELSFPQLARLFTEVTAVTEIVGFTVTEHLPWDMMDLRDFLAGVSIFQ